MNKPILSTLYPIKYTSGTLITHLNNLEQFIIPNNLEYITKMVLMVLHILTVDKHARIY